MTFYSAKDPSAYLVHFVGIMCYICFVVEPLRVKQKEVARELILQAAADEIVESSLEELSLQAVATRAGVSKRTLYNYFESRETLLASLVGWSDELTLEMGGYLVPETLDTMPEVVTAVWRTWDAQGTIYLAASMIDAASNETGISEGRQRRRDALADAVGLIRPDLNDQEKSEIGLLIHALGSAPVYRRLTAEDGLDIDAAGNLVGWAIRVLRDVLSEGDDPYRKEKEK